MLSWTTNFASLQILICLSLLGISLPASAQERPRVLGVSHIALKVSDIEKSRAFYKDFLGFAEPYQLEKNGALQLIAIKVNDEQCIELFIGLKGDEDRLHQIAFFVDNAEAARALLASRGSKVPDRVPKGRTGNSNFTVQDPDGHTVEIVQYEPTGWTVRDKGKFMPDTRTTERISHIGFTVADYAASMKFYGDIFGFKEIWRGSRDDKTISYINLKVPDGDDYIEFMLAGKSGSLGSMNHLGLAVPDVEKVRVALENNPYRKTYTRPIEIKTGKNHKRQLNLFDPDGTRVEFMEFNTVDGKPMPPSDLPLPTP